MWKDFKKWFVPKAFYYLVKFLYATNKKVYHHPKDEKEPFITCMWHGDLLGQIYNYHNFRDNGTIKAIISESRDGETIARLAAMFKIWSIRGSSSKGGARVIIKALKELKIGNDIAISPDGPRGPRFSIADGIVIISQKSGRKIRCFNTIPSRYWQMNSWDRFVLPKPFGKIDFYISEAFSIEGLEVEEAKALIKNKMMKHSLA